jgi:hypothetical protein
MMKQGIVEGMDCAYLKSPEGQTINVLDVLAQFPIYKFCKFSAKFLQVCYIVTAERATYLG